VLCSEYYKCFEKKKQIGTTNLPIANKTATIIENIILFDVSAYA